MALQQIVEQTVAGLGYDLVEIERSPGGLLRVTIDLPWQQPTAETQDLPEQFITVEDCEKVTRQLQFALEVDGAPVVAAVRADYIVRAGGRRWVAEVKTGRAAPSLATATTRRQLLEYQHAFGVAGVLLVDADARTVQRVDFRPPGRLPVRALVLFTAVLAAAAAWFGHGIVDSGCMDAASFRMKSP